MKFQKVLMMYYCVFTIYIKKRPDINVETQNIFYKYVCGDVLGGVNLQSSVHLRESSNGVSQNPF